MVSFLTRNVGLSATAKPIWESDDPEAAHLNLDEEWAVEVTYTGTTIVTEAGSPDVYEWSPQFGQAFRTEFPGDVVWHWMRELQLTPNNYPELYEDQDGKGITYPGCASCGAEQRPFGGQGHW